MSQQSENQSSKYIPVVIYSVLAAMVILSLMFLLRPEPVEVVVPQQPTESTPQLYAVIATAHGEVERIPLANTEDQIISIEEKTGLPITFEIKDGAIRFASSSCPDQICVYTGYQSRYFDIASCLPRGVILVIEEE